MRAAVRASMRAGIGASIGVEMRGNVGDPEVGIWRLAAETITKEVVQRLHHLFSIPDDK